MSDHSHAAAELQRLRDTDLSEAQLIAMGEVSVWAARLERMLALVVANLTSKRSDAAVLVTNGLPFARLCDLGRQLSALRPDAHEIRREFERLDRLRRSAMERRNEVLHSDWSPREGGRALATFTRSRRTTRREFSVEEVQGVANDLAVLAGDLLWLYVETISPDDSTID